jgi:predicted RNA polymerase sigma factor
MDSIAAYGSAIASTENEVERAFLQRRREDLSL